MITHPTSGELLDAVSRFLEQQVAPQMKDRDAFLIRVAINALATVKREGEKGVAIEADARTRMAALLGHDGTADALEVELCDLIRSGQIPDDDPALIAHLRASAVARIGIDQPGYSGLKAALEITSTAGDSEWAT